MALQIDKVQNSESLRSKYTANTTISPKDQACCTQKSARESKTFNNPLGLSKSVKFKDINSSISPITERVSLGSKASKISPISNFSPVKGSSLEMSPEQDICYSNRPSSNFRSRFQL